MAVALSPSPPAGARPSAASRTMLAMSKAS
uniref:Uncharacterized protein n=1 Tax=Arundo donax TaxID=35708 RepID=A0A0A8ZV45_ARUDO